jgi:hypothetical protein
MHDIQDILIMLFGGILLGVLILRGGNLGNQRRHGKRARRQADLNPGTVAGAAMRSPPATPMTMPADSAIARLADAASDAQVVGAGSAPGQRA